MTIAPNTLTGALSDPNARIQNGRFRSGTRTLPSLNEQLVAKTLRGHPSECWPWAGKTAGRGYGVLVFGRASVYAHRLVFFLGHGYWPSVCRHRCDYPACVNLEHLEDGTTQDNINDAVVRGRTSKGRQRKTHCERGHELSGENLALYTKANGNTRRACRACKRKLESDWARAKYKKRRESV